MTEASLAPQADNSLFQHIKCNVNHALFLYRLRNPGIVGVVGVQAHFSK